MVGRYIRAAIEAKGAICPYLLPHLRDLNPTEPAFAWLKTLLRNAAVRIWESLWNVIAEVIKVFAQYGCAKYFTCVRRSSSYMRITRE